MLPSTYTAPYCVMFILTGATGKDPPKDILFPPLGMISVPCIILNSKVSLIFMLPKRSCRKVILIFRFSYTFRVKSTASSPARAPLLVQHDQIKGLHLWLIGNQVHTCTVAGAV